MVLPKLKGYERTPTPPDIKKKAKETHDEEDRKFWKKQKLWEDFVQRGGPRPPYQPPTPIKTVEP